MADADVYVVFLKGKPQPTRITADDVEDDDDAGFVVFYLDGEEVGRFSYEVFEGRHLEGDD